MSWQFCESSRTSRLFFYKI